MIYNKIQKAPSNAARGAKPSVRSMFVEAGDSLSKVNALIFDVLQYRRTCYFLLW
jgi:hypothetical protein